MKLLIALILCAILTACGTPFGNQVANVIESPGMQAIIQFGTAAGTNYLVSQYGKSLSPDQQDAIRQAATAAATQLTSGIAYAGAEALRTKQSTPKAATTGVLAAAMVNQANVPYTTAVAISGKVNSLTSSGVPSNISNETIAVVQDAVASKLAKL